MDTKELKKFAAKRVKELKKEWEEEANSDHRKRAVDYIRIGEIEGQIDAYVEMITKMS